MSDFYLLIVLLLLCLLSKTKYNIEKIFIRIRSIKNMLTVAA